MKTLLSILTLALLPLTATAQNIWRCGPDGRAFSDTPCPHGRQIDTPQARPAADIHAAQQQAARDLHQAELLRRERLADEAQRRGNGLTGIGPQAAKVKAAKLSKVKHPGKLRKAPPEGDGTWRAVAPATRRAKG